MSWSSPNTPNAAQFANAPARSAVAVTTHGPKLLPLAEGDGGPVVRLRRRLRAEARLAVQMPRHAIRAHARVDRRAGILHVEDLGAALERHGQPAAAAKQVDEGMAAGIGMPICVAPTASASPEIGVWSSTWNATR